MRRALAVLVLVPAVAFSLGPQRRPHYMLPALAPLSILLALFACALFARARAVACSRWIPTAAALVCATTVATEVVLAGSPRLWSHERWVVAELGAHAARALPAATPLLAFGPGPAALSYYAGRPVRGVRSAMRLSAP